MEEKEQEEEEEEEEKEGYTVCADLEMSSRGKARIVSFA